MTSNAPNFTQPDKYIYNPYSGTCYMRYDTPKLSWEDARTACENEGYGVRVSTFKTQVAAQFIKVDYRNASDGGEFSIPYTPKAYISTNFRRFLH